MTQEELITRLYELQPSHIVQLKSAILSVIELHGEKTLIEGKVPDSEFRLQRQICVACSFVTDEITAYPCPTIQAIEKEIK